MSNGVLIPFLAPRRFDYSFLPSGGTQVITLEAALDTQRYSYVGLYVRVHQRSMTAGQSLVISLFNTVPSDDDTSEFFDSTSVLDATVTNSAPTSTPGICYDYTTRFGPFLKIALIPANQLLASTGTLYAELSAVLELRAQ